MTSPLAPARVPILDDNDRIYAEQLPLTPPAGWGGGTTGAGTADTVDTLAGTGSVGRDLMRAQTTDAVRQLLGTATVAAASTTTAGVVELATPDEVKAGTATALAVTPAGLAAELERTPLDWYPRAGGIATGPVDMVAGTFPPHPITNRVLVYWTRPGLSYTTDGNRVTGGGGMDVVRQPPDRSAAL